MKRTHTLAICVITALFTSLSNAQPMDYHRRFDATKKKSAVMDIGLNPELENAAKATIHRVEEKYVIEFSKNDTNYGVVLLGLYMTNFHENDKEDVQIKGISIRDKMAIVGLMDEAIKSKNVLGWFIFRYRSSTVEFIGCYKGIKDKQKLILDSSFQAPSRIEETFGFAKDARRGMRRSLRWRQ